MNENDIAVGVLAGWLVPDRDGWFRFVFDFTRDADGRWVKKPASGIRRVRLVR